MKISFINWCQWQIAKTIYGINAAVLDYKYPVVQKFVNKIWPKGYSKEAPSWSMIQRETKCIYCRKYHE